MTIDLLLRIVSIAFICWAFELDWKNWKAWGVMAALMGIAWSIPH